MTCVLCATQPLRGATPCEPDPGNDFDRQIVGTPLPNIARHLVLRYSLRNCDRYLDSDLRTSPHPLRALCRGAHALFTRQMLEAHWPVRGIAHLDQPRRAELVVCIES